MVTPPDKIPVTTPVDEFTEAMELLLLLHTPPVTVSLRVMLELTQTAVGPLITFGSGFTVTLVVT